MALSGRKAAVYKKTLARMKGKMSPAAAQAFARNAAKRAKG